MAVCNLFSNLRNSSGNFMMFSQYVEDITRNTSDGDNWKVVPTGFVALDVDYLGLDPEMVTPNEETLNIGIPKYFQNCFENACAYGRVNNPNWSPTISRNLFWNFMFDGKFVHADDYKDTDTKYVPEIVYYGDINMHSYNEHQGMGYGEIYCYIPTDAPRMNCQVVAIAEAERSYDNSNTNEYLEGFTDNDEYTIDGYKQQYSYNNDFTMSFDDEEIGELNHSNENKYNVNTIVVLYSVFCKSNDDWQPLYSNIPMGMYITGNFDATGNISNIVNKFVSTSYDAGTSYGLRICTRLSSTGAGQLVNTDVVADDSGYTNICQLMTAMNENLSRMMDITKASLDTTQQYKELLSIFKNNRTNVPYVKTINGVDYWFVNGRFVSAVNSGITEIIPECNHECNTNINIDDAVAAQIIEQLSAEDEDVTSVLNNIM